MAAIGAPVLGTLALGMSAGILAAAFSSPAAAQSTELSESRTTTVMDRQRPELDPLGMHAGSFLLLPSLDLTEKYNDNIYATDTGTKDDFITSIKPGIEANSDWNSHSLRLHANGTINRYASHDAEDNKEYDVGADGRFDVRRDTNIYGGGRFQQLYEDRGSPDAANGSEPTKYQLGTVSAGFYNKWNRVSVDASTRYRNYNYYNVPTSSGTTINNNDRDRNEYRVSLRGSYEIQPQYKAFTEVILTSVDYNSKVDDNGLNRDNSGYEVRAGARIDLTGLVFGDVFLGYLSRDYKDAALTTVDGLSAGTNITWNVTPLTTVIGTVSRTISETTLNAASGDLSSTAQARVDHELLRNLILSGRLGFTQDKFEGTSRKDDYLKGMFQAKYMMNRNFYLTLLYEHTDRNSSTSGADYKQNIVFLRLKAQL